MSNKKVYTTKEKVLIIAGILGLVFAMAHCSPNEQQVAETPKVQEEVTTTPEPVPPPEPTEPEPVDYGEMDA